MQCCSLVLSSLVAMGTLLQQSIKISPQKHGKSCMPADWHSINSLTTNIKLKHFGSSFHTTQFLLATTAFLSYPWSFHLHIPTKYSSSQTQCQLVLCCCYRRLICTSPQVVANFEPESRADSDVQMPQVRTLHDKPGCVQSLPTASFSLIWVAGQQVGTKCQYGIIIRSSGSNCHLQNRSQVCNLLQPCLSWAGRFSDKWYIVPIQVSYACTEQWKGDCMKTLARPTCKGPLFS